MRKTAPSNAETASATGTIQLALLEHIKSNFARLGLLRAGVLEMKGRWMIESIARLPEQMKARSSFRKMGQTQIEAKAIG